MDYQNSSESVNPLRVFALVAFGVLLIAMIVGVLGGTIFVSKYPYYFGEICSGAENNFCKPNHRCCPFDGSTSCCANAHDNCCENRQACCPEHYTCCGWNSLCCLPGEQCCMVPFGHQCAQNCSNIITSQQKH